MALLRLAALGAALALGAADCPAANVNLQLPAFGAAWPGDRTDREVRVYGTVHLDAAVSVRRDGTGSHSGTGHVRVQCPKHYRGYFDFYCPYGATAWATGYTVPVDDGNAANFQLGATTSTDGVAAANYDDGTAETPKVVSDAEALHHLTAAADAACKLDNNYELMSSLVTDDMNSAVLRCDKNSISPGVSSGANVPVVHDASNAGDSGDDVSGGFESGDAIGVAIEPLNIFSQTPYFASSSYSGLAAYVAPSRTEATVPNIALTGASGAAYGGTSAYVNHGVEQGSLNLPSGNYHDAYGGTAVAAALGLDAPLTEPVDGYAASQMLRTSRPMQGGGARLWKQMARQATENGACMS